MHGQWREVPSTDLRIKKCCATTLKLYFITPFQVQICSSKSAKSDSYKLMRFVVGQLSIPDHTGKAQKVPQTLHSAEEGDTRPHSSHSHD